MECSLENNIIMSAKRSEINNTHDFDGEFDQVKELTVDELKNDKLIKRIRLEKRLKEIENRNTGAFKSGLDPADAITTSDMILEDEKFTHQPRTYSKKNTSPKLRRTNRLASTISQLPDSSLDNSDLDDLEILEGESDQPVSSNVTRKRKPLRVTGKEEFLHQLKMKKKKRKHRKHTKDEDEIKNNEIIEVTDHEEIKNNERSKILEIPLDPIQMKYEETTPDQTIREESFQQSKNDIINEFTTYNPEPHDVEVVKKSILSQLIGKTVNFPNLSKSPALADKYKEIYLMFEHTVKDNEGHSVLLVGPRSSGKTAMVEHALKELGDKFPEQFLTIKLSAYLHSDDNIAVREIARQLDYNAQKFNANDDENSEEQDDEAENITHKFEQRGISDTFNNILAILDDASKKGQPGSKQSISLIFIIDEFEKYTHNNKQALLYNLFDLSQTSSIPICVVGISTRITTRESLEKRVTSRFSQRVISLSRPNNIDDFWANAKLGLIINENTHNLLIDKMYGDLWNKHIDLLYAEKIYHTVASNLKKIIFQNFYTIKNYKEFNNNCLYPVSQISQESPFFNDKNLEKYVAHQPTNNIQDIIQSLSQLELLLVIAAARWIKKVDLHVLNFNMVYREYEEMMKILNTMNVSSTSSSVDHSILSNIRVNQKVWSSKVLKNSWETLYKLGIVLDVITNSNEINNANNNINKNFIIEETKMVLLDVTLGELAHMIDELSIYKKLTKI